MNRPVRPAHVAAPAASYELAMTTPAGASFLHTAGVVGTRPDGSISPVAGEQAAQAWRTIGALLQEAGFEVADIVSYTTYVVFGADLDAVMGARDAFLADHRAASTLVTVPALVQPPWLVEVAVVAARTG